LLQRLKPPSVAFPFGTDNLGRDIFSRVILGTRNALLVAVAVITAAMLIGVPIGLFAGWREGWLSELLMRTTDVFLAVPQLILALALGQLLAPGIGAAMVALALTYWPFFARTVFAETRRLRGSLFVDALAGHEKIHKEKWQQYVRQYQDRVDVFAKTRFFGEAADPKNERAKTSAWNDVIRLFETELKKLQADLNALTVAYNDDQKLYDKLSDHGRNQEGYDPAGKNIEAVDNGLKLKR
jgi:hypothetical protein